MKFWCSALPIKGICSDLNLKLVSLHEFCSLNVNPTLPYYDSVLAPSPFFGTTWY